MRKHILATAFAVFLCNAAWALPITYTVTAGTSSLTGTTGSLDFNFNPGPLVSQAASVQILNFMTDGGVSGTPSTLGDVSGALPGTLTFDNGTPFNDYFQQFNFGSSLTFGVSLFGPALSSPDGVSTSGSTFAFSIFSDLAGTIPALTTDTVNGFGYLVNVNLDGTTTVTNNLTSGGSVGVTPEPGTFSLLGTALLGCTLRLVKTKSWKRAKVSG